MNATVRWTLSSFALTVPSRPSMRSPPGFGHRRVPHPLGLLRCQTSGCVSRLCRLYDARTIAGLATLAAAPRNLGENDAIIHHYAIIDRSPRQRGAVAHQVGVQQATAGAHDVHVPELRVVNRVQVAHGEGSQARLQLAHRPAAGVLRTRPSLSPTASPRRGFGRRPRPRVVAPARTDRTGTNLSSTASP